MVVKWMQPESAGNSWALRSVLSSHRAQDKVPGTKKGRVRCWWVGSGANRPKAELLCLCVMCLLEGSSGSRLLASVKHNLVLICHGHVWTLYGRTRGYRSHITDKTKTRRSIAKALKSYSLKSWFATRVTVPQFCHTQNGMIIALFSNGYCEDAVQ